MSKQMRLALVVLILALPLLAACGQTAAGSTAVAPAATAPAAAATSGTGAQGAATPAPVQIALKNLAFEPKAVTVPVGTTVTWVNQDAFAHTVTAGTRGSPSGVFDSANLAAGASFSFTFTKAGTFPYFCAIHAGMDGTVTVQ
jgi:plastocyanin